MSSFVPATTYNHSDYSAANLIWNPLGSSLNVGAEFFYGWRQLRNGSKEKAGRDIMFNVTDFAAAP